MYKPSKKTIYLTGAFAAVAGLVGVYSYWNDISYAVCDKVYPEANEGEVRLKDNQGNRYSLLNHGDGKETALYDDIVPLPFTEIIVAIWCGMRG